MKIKTSLGAPTAPTIPPCDHCGGPSKPFCQLFLHIGDNPPDGRVTTHVISQGFRFCSAACREAWWDVPTDAALVPEAALLASPHPLTALVCHVDPHTAHLTIDMVDDLNNVLAVQSGEAASYHALDDLGHLERWWRGEAESVPIALGDIEIKTAAPETP